MQRSILDFFSKPSKTPIITSDIVDSNNNDTCNSEVKEIKKLNKLDYNCDPLNRSSKHNISKKLEPDIKESCIESEDDDIITTKPKGFKRLRVISDDESSDIENNYLISNKKRIKSSIIEVKTLNKNENCSSPISSKKIIISKPITPSTKSFLSSFHTKTFSDVNESQNKVIESSNIDESFNHLSLDFLKKDYIMDNQKRKYDNPDYDGTTLFVPYDFMSKLTPGMRQWWQMKANGMYDTLLFFKVGKFYELYHMDAVIAVNELGISFMRGSYAHCGFPEIAFTKMSDQLVQKGYKVARVEQTETVEAMTERCQKRPTKDKVVNREICQIVTPGTRTFSLRHSSVKLSSQDEGDDLTIGDSVGAILYAIKESSIDDPFRKKSRFVVEIGIALVNTNTGRFMVAQFDDDNQRSKLRTMFSLYSPNEIIYQKGDLSKDTQHLFNTTLAAIKKEGLIKGKQFLTAEDALKRLLEGEYFIDTHKNRISNYGLPIGLTEVLNEGDNLGRSPASQFVLAVNSLGGLIYYLQKCLIDKYLISLADFVVYYPTDQNKLVSSQIKCSEPFYMYQSNMILDSNAIHNLDLLKNSTTGGIEGTLLERLDFTSTSFGKRLLLQWVATPLCVPSSIIERQDSISELMELESQLSSVRQKLKSLPDLEKLIARIHAVGLTKSISNHPDSRAVLYENVRYSRAQINDFIVTINAFKTIRGIQSIFCDLNVEGKIKSTLLKKLTLCKRDDETGLFPDLEETINFFQGAFNHDQAKKDGKIIPEKGVDEDFDFSVNEIKKIESDLEKYLKEQCVLLNCKINYFGSGRNRYQLEIPESKCNNVPESYVASSQRKGFKRYETIETQRILGAMTSAEERRDIAMKNIMNRIFAKFDEYYPLWTLAINCLAQLDVIMSLSCFSRGVDGGSMTKPIIKNLSSNVKPFLLINEGRYPCKAKTQSGEFISNTIELGHPCNNIENKKVMILTGPNMGGKSTLMRQTALIIILSQLGCYIPAEGPVVLTPVDRLLTRQGANDAIGSGQSTLQVEMNETASIISYMTANSFLLVDELGRGTATHDGCALACSILNAIVDKCEPRTIFSTHFHKLLEEKTLLDKLQLCHMACMVEEDINLESNNETKLQNITFLYKLTSGGCPKSYGFNVARLANITEKIIINGLNKSKLFEEETLILEFKQLLMACNNGKIDFKTELKMWQHKFKKIYNF